MLNILPPRHRRPSFWQLLSRLTCSHAWMPYKNGRRICRDCRKVERRG